MTLPPCHIESGLKDGMHNCNGHAMLQNLFPMGQKGQMERYHHPPYRCPCLLYQLFYLKICHFYQARIWYFHQELFLALMALPAFPGNLVQIAEYGSLR